MTKTKTAETIEFPTFDAGPATDQFRAFAEKSVEHSKEAYTRFKAGAEDAQKTLEATYEQARAAASELSLKSIAAMRAHSEANLAHLEALVTAKSFSDVVELQTSFLRRQYETLIEQSKDFQAASTKAAEDVSKPMKGAFEKALKELQVA